MNKVFDFKRFGRYYVSDLRGVFNENWLTILLMSLGVVIAYVFCGLMHLLTNGAWASYPLVGRLITFLVLFGILLLINPAKEYGFLTEKRRGSFFLLLPASSFEKTLAMIINVAILTPLAFCVIAFTSDALLCLIDPNCGDSMVATLFSADSYSDMAVCDLDIKLNSDTLIWGTIANIVSGSLIYLIGALYFKKAKVAKTILCLIGLMMVFFIVLIAIFSEGSWLEWAESVDDLEWLDGVLSVIVLLGLSVWTYFRVKTIKH